MLAYNETCQYIATILPRLQDGDVPPRAVRITPWDGEEIVLRKHTDVFRRELQIPTEEISWEDPYGILISQAVFNKKTGKFLCDPGSFYRSKCARIFYIPGINIPEDGISFRGYISEREWYCILAPTAEAAEICLKSKNISFVRLEKCKTAYEWDNCSVLYARSNGSELPGSIQVFWEKYYEMTSLERVKRGIVEW